MNSKTIYKQIIWMLLCVFSITSFFPPSLASAQNVSVPTTALGLPQPGVMVPLSGHYEPIIIRGIKVHPNKPFHFDFIVDSGEESLQEQELRDQSTKLIKYFLASLATPDEDLWVNLSPYEKNRIVPDEFGQTEMGRDLLAQDYILKQITASLMYPENELGKAFWDRVYQKAQNLYGTTDVPVDTFNKVWVVPQDAVIYENGGTAFIVESRLKVMLEEDYLAREASAVKREIGDSQATISASIIREVLIPEIEREINEGKTLPNCVKFTIHLF